MAIIDLVDVINHSTKANQAIVTLSITVVILFVGAYGSYTHSRTYLLTFALVLIITLIVGFLAPNAPYSTLGTNVVMIVLAATQAELIRRGYH